MPAPRAQKPAVGDVVDERASQSAGPKAGATRKAVRGPEEVREALIEAALSLMAERVPSAISGRELAAEAGVNYGLIHQYFGGKNEVFRAALIELSAIAERETWDLDRNAPARAFTLFDKSPKRLRVWAHMSLDRDAFDLVGADFPSIQRLLVHTAQRHGYGPDDPLPPELRARVAAAVCLQMGWAVFEPMMVRATGLVETPQDEVLGVLADVVRELLAVDVDPGLTQT